ncbi:unnamed protein product [Adineta steineri]|uniref:MARVEL domain-containing protein n=1 Tax=Adineta steineri TaxID=433720 RepID=A0A815TP40_9BILA|nr:unnamed protein product [Adineta steineri]CAF1646040.1 unnamed protein product [Adineta steineri]
MDYESKGVTCRVDYIRSIPGILKIIELFCDLLGTALAGAGPAVDSVTTGQRGFFLFVSIVALIITTVLLVLGLLNIHNVFLTGRWPIIEFCWCAFISLFYFIASIVIATVGKYDGRFGAAAFFGFAAFITYVAEAVLQFRAYRSGGSQGQREQQYGVNPPPPPPTRPQPTY